MRPLANIFESDLAFIILKSCQEEITPTELIKKTRIHRTELSNYLRDLMKVPSVNFGEGVIKKPVLSKYLRFIRDGKLISFRKDGTKRYYKINKPQVKAYLKIRRAIFQKRIDEIDNFW